MKTLQRNLIPACLAIVCGMVLLTSTARAEDKPLPPEVKKLIGMRIQDTASGRNGEVPGWTMHGGEVFYRSSDMADGGVIAGYFKNNLSVFTVEVRNEKEKNRTILDAQKLPRDLLTYYVKNGKAITKKQWWKFYVATVLCYRERGEIIVGLMRPEKGRQDCSHKTSQIKRAWKVDKETGRISEISPQGVSCSYMGGEYSCDPE